MPTGGLDILAGSFLADTFGAGIAGALGTAAFGGEIGAGLGGLESAFSGKNILKGVGEGALGGALTGGGIGLGGDLLGSTIGATAADAVGGAAGGALGGKLTGGNPLTGALEGAASGGIAGALSPSGTPSTSGASTAGGGAGASASGAAAPTSVAQGFSPDATVLDQGFGTNSTISPSLKSASSVANSTTGSPSTSSPNVGDGTTGTKALSAGDPNAFTGFASGPGGANIPGATDGFGGAFTPATSTPSSLKQLIADPSFANAGNVITSNPGVAISAAGLGIDAIKGNASSGAEKNLKAEASQLNQQGNQLEGYLQSGSLPPGLQAGVNQASEAAKATIRSQYASRGMSGSSAEQQDLAQVDQRAQAQGAQMAMQLMQTGISETGMASQLYQSLLSDSMKNDATLGSAISNFASAAAGGGSFGKGGQTFTLNPS